jgi:hypothetical protein
MGSQIRLIVDNPAPTRAQLVHEAVLGAAHASFPWGVMHLGVAQVLQKILWTEHGLPHFAAEVRLAFRVQNDEADNLTASTPRGMA